MGVHILHDQRADQAALFCSTSDWAFGPVFCAQGGKDAYERAQAFLRWLDANPPAPPVGRLLGSRFDVRVMTDKELERAYVQWLGQEKAQYAAEEAFEEAERMAYADEARAEQREYDEARLHPERFV